MPIIQFFLFGKMVCLINFLAKMYEILQINPNEYSITIKTTLKHSNTIYCAYSLPMNIYNNEMVNVVLHMAYM